MKLILANAKGPIQTVELRTKNNPNSYCFDKQYLTIDVTINLQRFGMELINVDPLRRSEFIDDIERIESANEWLREMYVGHNLNVNDNMDEQYEEVLNLLRRKMKKIAKKYNLGYTQKKEKEKEKENK